MAAQFAALCYSFRGLTTKLTASSRHCEPHAEKMDNRLIDHLQELVSAGHAIDNNGLIGRWKARVAAFLKTALGDNEREAFGRIGSAPYSFDELGSMLGHLEGMIAREASAARGASQLPSTTLRSPAENAGLGYAADSRKVFIVHGHDDLAKESLARFLAKISLEPIILHEQASEGRTIIEKFETYSEGIAFAVILLTPDDVGAAATHKEHLNPRARQNVILELGYFMGRLGRARVCALHKAGVELPSDYQGIVYIELDRGGSWKLKLAQELIKVPLPIELNGLLGS